MWIRINDILNLEKHEEKIGLLFNKYGKIYSQHFLSLKANLLSNNKFSVYLDEDNHFLLALEETKLNYYSSSIQGHPVLGLNYNNISRLSESLIGLKKMLNYSIIYFPLVYEDDLLNDSRFQSKEKISWFRLPNPIFDQTISSKKISQQLSDRYRSRANRQKIKFEKKLHTAYAKNEDSKKIIKIIEEKSWKKEFGQSMLSRGNQFSYYTQIIKLGLAKLKVAYDDKIPVAYRIESEVNNILYTIKWSFDQDYRKYSPGFYLLTFDLFKDYENSNIKYIDLYGSPDTLKDLIETRRIQRLDVCLTGDLEIAKEIKMERENFDSVIHENYKSRGSIKKTYIKNNGE